MCEGSIFRLTFNAKLLNWPLVAERRKSTEMDSEKVLDLFWRFKESKRIRDDLERFDIYR